MKLIKEHPIYKTICLTQGDFSGKFTLSFDGVELKKTGKVTFEYIDPESGTPINVTVSGNVFKGFCLVVKSEIILMSPSAKWYDIALAVVPALTCLLFIRGAVGGALAGGMAMLALILNIQRPTVKQKVLISLILTAAGAVVSFILALVIGILFASLGLV